jgi:hypothetical protein
VYDGPEGRLHLVWDNGRVFVHADINEPERVHQYKEILSALESELINRGVRTYYTLADSPATFRYNSLFGFRSNLEVWDDVYEVMVKEI